MGSAPKNSPDRHAGFGTVQHAPGVRAVTKDAKDKGVKNDVTPSQDSQTVAKTGRRAPAVLDRWFDAQLGRLYSDVASEPVPVEMLQLISKLKKPKQPGS